MKSWYPLLTLLLFIACLRPNKDTDIKINTDHLNHLYEEFYEETDRIGSIWIYCEEPDYNLVTDDDEGYTCVDDVARGLIFYSKEFLINPTDSISDRIISLTNFILSMQEKNGFFYNFRFPNKKINRSHQNSIAEANWWSWRAFWALSEVLKIEDPIFSTLKVKVNESLNLLLPAILDICSNNSGVFLTEGVATMNCIRDMGSDQVSVLLIGLSNYYTLNPSPEIRIQLENLSKILISKQAGDEKTFPYFASLSWKNIWHAWGNSQAYALIKVGNLLEDQKIISAGLREVDYFIPFYLENRPSFFSLKKENDSLQILETSNFPQIAYNLRPMIYATLEANKHTKKDQYIKQAIELGQWFFGNNQGNTTMYDVNTGRTYDGIISETEINKNSGAESTIEALLSLQALKENELVWNALSEMSND